MKTFNCLLVLMVWGCLLTGSAEAQTETMQELLDRVALSAIDVGTPDSIATGVGMNTTWYQIVIFDTLAGAGGEERYGFYVYDKGGPSEAAWPAPKLKRKIAPISEDAILTALKNYLKPMQGTINGGYISSDAPLYEQWAVCTIYEDSAGMSVEKRVLVTYDGTFNKQDIQ